MTRRTTVQRWAPLASLASLAAVQAHGGGEEIPPASIAGQPSRAGAESYVQKHMASEHHIGAFDLGSFFSLHDLNRDGTLDRAEIEAIYGVHHSTSVKHSPDYEVHDEKANKIVKEVLRRLDKDGDGLITQREFISAGPDGLPAFEEDFGKGILGHHYDEESEYFVHHEEIYHNTPETQKDSAYVHQEDIDHFAHHEKLEQEEERRERFAEGLPTKEEDEARRKAAEARGEKYVSPYDAQMPKPDSPAAPQYAYESHADSGFAHQEGWQATEHVFRTPEGDKVVKTGPIAGSQDEPGKPAVAAPPGFNPLDDYFPRRVPGETAEGFKDRMTAHAQKKLAASEFAKVNPNLAARPGIDPKTGEVVQAPGETAEEFLKRKARAQYATTKAKPAYVAPSKQDTRKSAPYKYPPIQNRLKKSSYFGEF